MKREEIKQHFGEQLKSNAVLLVERVPSTRKPGTFDYQFAQLRKPSVNAELSGIAAVRNTKFEDQIMMTWVNSVDAESDKNNEGVFYTTDQQGNYMPISREDFNIRVRETAELNPSLIYVDKESGELTIRDGKRRTADGNFLAAANGNPIWRSTVLINKAYVAEDKDITVTAVAELTEEAHDDKLAALMPEAAKMQAAKVAA